MAVAFRSYTDALGAKTTSHVVNAPSGAASGDVIYGHWYTGDAITWTQPSGWAVLINTSDGTYGSALVCRKVLSAAPDATYTAVASVSCDAWGTLSAWTGADTTTPEDVAAASAQSDDATAPEITTATNGAMLLSWWAENDNETGAPPGGMTAIKASPGPPSYVMAYETRATAGATGTRIATGLTFRCTCASVGIRPAVAAAAVPNAAMLMGIGI